MGPAYKDFAEWKDIRARLEVWRRDAQFYAEELLKLEEQIEREDRNAPVSTIRLLPSGIELLRAASEFGKTLATGTSAVLVAPTNFYVAAALAGLGVVSAVMEWRDAVPIIKRDEIPSAIVKLRALVHRISGVIAEHDENASYWEQPWERVAAEVDAVAHTIGPARLLDKELHPQFRRAEELRRRFR